MVIASTSTGNGRRLFGGVLTALLGLSSGALADPDLPAVELMLHHRPPYYMVQDAQPGGIVVAPVLQALSESGLRHFWTEVPPPRQLQAIRRSDAPVCGIGWFQTAERREFARFSRSLYTGLPMVVLTRADDARTQGYGNLEALFADPELTFGIRDGYAYGSVIDDLLDRSRPAIFSSDRDTAGMAALLLIGRFDYMLLADEEIDGVRRALRTDFARLRRLTFHDMPMGGTRHLMCSRAVPPAWIEQLERALPVATAGTRQDLR